MGVKTAKVRFSTVYYHTMASERITINVGGRKFMVKENDFDKFPYSLLCNLKTGNFYDKVKKEYFFDRDPDAFRYILEYCRTGRLHVSDEECFSGLLDEMEFFRIPTEDVYPSTCCEEECSFNLQQIIDKHHPSDADSDQDLNCYQIPTTREKVWRFFSEEESSTAASIYSYFIHLVTVFSAVLIAVETVACEVDRKCGDVHEEMFSIANATCVALFTVDYVVRFYCAPERRKFVRGILNIIDLLALLPFYLAMTLKYVFGVQEDYSFISVLRLFRVFRIIKLAKRSERIRTIAESLGGSGGGGGGGTEMFFVLFGLFMVLVVFSTVIFFMEQASSETQFASIPDTMWYTAVTITSLG
ncbi:hypothetical protein QZH41_001087 [Actinostola sp. cb2023]|nr:hypothetical protein QZH41_001087 [Actinostola sp. cb2023]